MDGKFTNRHPVFQKSTNIRNDYPLQVSLSERKLNSNSCILLVLALRPCARESQASSIVPEDVSTRDLAAE